MGVSATGTVPVSSTGKEPDVSNDANDDNKEMTSFEETQPVAPVAEELKIEDESLLHDFIVEGLEYIDEIETNILNLEKNPDDKDFINAIFRPFHSIKGVASFLNLDRIRDLAHTLENLLDKARNGETAVTPPVIDVVLSGADVLKALCASIEGAGAPYLKKDAVARGDVSGIIGPAGSVKGSLALGFEESCILEIVSSMLGEQSSEINAEICDAVGELTNMVSGAARKNLEVAGLTILAALPTVISGKGHKITHVMGGPSIIIPFETAKGNFVVDICIDDKK